MSLTPEQIVAEEFRLRARGYDRDEVDAYLDRLADQVEADVARVRDVEERLVAVEADLADAREREATLTRTLATVQDAADRARTEADDEVAALRAATESELTVAREQVQQEAVRLRASAEHEAERVRGDAFREAEQVRSDAQHEAAELRAHLAAVQQLDASHRAQLRGHLQAQLDELDALPDPYPDLQARLAPAPGHDESAPRAAFVPADPADGRSDGLGDHDPTPDTSLEHHEDAVDEFLVAFEPRSEDVPGDDTDTPDPHPQDVRGDDTDAPDPHPQDVPGDLDPADGDDGDDPWRRRDERGQPEFPDPPIWS